MLMGGNFMKNVRVYKNRGWTVTSGVSEDTTPEEREQHLRMTYEAIIDLQRDRRETEEL